VKPEQFFKAFAGSIERAVGQALTEASPDIKRTVSLAIPAKRKLTKQALQVQTRKTSLGCRVIVRLKFTKQYNARNTETAKLFREACTKSRTAIKAVIQHHLTRKTTGVSK
jgi:hypothetical protein